MKSYVFESFGDDLAGLKVRNVPCPTPSEGQVLIKIRACALNARDLMVAHDRYPVTPKPAPGIVPLSDAAGDVVEVGPGVHRLAVGDRVIPSFFQTWLSGTPEPGYQLHDLGGNLDGVLSEYVLLDQQGASRFPDHLSYEEAATLGCAGVTAWTSLTRGRRLRPGQTVLTLGASNVSLFAIQFAKLSGAIVIATTSSSDKAEKLRKLGADHVIDYRASAEWHTAVRDLTAGRGVDRIVEVGGPSTFQQSLAAIATGGQISVTGFLGGVEGTISPLQLMSNHISTHAISVGSRSDVEEMLQAIAAHGTRPLIDRAFAFDEAASAFWYFASGKHFGKVVIAGA